MKKAGFIGCLIIVLLGLIGGGVLLVTQIPDVAEQRPSNSSPIIVTLTTPPNDATIPLNDATTISVDAIGPAPIVAIELWVDGVRLFTKTSDAGVNPFTAVWAWQPSSEGTHTFVARARDAQQREGQSNLVRVTASKNEDPTTQVAYKTQPGDTVPIIAQKFKTTPQQVIDANPQINPNNPLPPGQDVAVPVPEQPEPGPGAENSTPEASSENPPPPPNPGQDAPPNPPDKTWIWIKALATLFAKSNPPAKPELTAVVEGCNVKLTIVDKAFNEDGFYLHRDGAKPSLKPIATFGEKSGTGAFNYTDANLAQGTYVYSIEAFNAAGNALSNVAQVKIADSQCASSIDWSKVFPVFKLKAKQAVDKVYCYLKINDGAWNRIPHADNTFLLPNAQGTFDVEAYLKGLPIVTLNKLTLELDCWGWKGNQLIHLGKAKETLSGQVQMIANQFEVTGEIPPMIDLSGLGGIPGITPGAQNFLSGEVPAILPPGNLKRTTDPKECTSHMPGPLAVLGGAFTCQATTSNSNYAVLVWEWIGGCWPGQTQCVPHVDGYRVYREDFPAPTLVKQIKGEGVKVAMFTLPPQPWPLAADAPLFAKVKYQALAKNCYIVRAYKDGVGESPDSQKICLPWEMLSQTKNLTPSFLLSRSVWHEHREGLCSYGTAQPPVPAGQILAGYFHTYDDNCYYNSAWRGAVYFDLGSIPKNAIINYARLEYDLVKLPDQAILNGTTTGQKINCGNRLMLGKAEWMGKDFGDQKYWIPGETYTMVEPTDLTSFPNPLQVNVTSAVKEWVQGTRPNYGFVFRSGVEGLNHEDKNRCEAFYGNFHLVVSYQMP